MSSACATSAPEKPSTSRRISTARCRAGRCCRPATKAISTARPRLAGRCRADRRAGGRGRHRGPGPRRAVGRARRSRGRGVGSGRRPRTYDGGRGPGRRAGGTGAGVRRWWTPTRTAAAVAQQLGVLDEVSGLLVRGPAGRDGWAGGERSVRVQRVVGDHLAGGRPACPAPTAGSRCGGASVEHLLEVARRARPTWSSTPASASRRTRPASSAARPAAQPADPGGGRRRPTRWWSSASADPVGL